MLAAMVFMLVLTYVALIGAWCGAMRSRYWTDLAYSWADSARCKSAEASDHASRAFTAASRASATLACAEDLRCEKADPATDETLKALVLVREANDVGLSFTADCKAGQRFGPTLPAALERLKACGLIYLTKGDEEMPGGWCLTTNGELVARGLGDREEAPEPAPATAPEGKYGVIETSGKKLHPDEPVFLLRATDPFAANAVRMYANNCGMHGARIEHVKECHAAAARIEEWQKANPGLVKKFPD